MKLSVRLQALLLVTVVFVIYFPALGAGVNSVDDARIIAAYGMGPGKTLAEVVRPSANYYYRPLIELSYYLDNLFWGMLSRPMHLENVLLHALNALLVFFLGRQLAQAFGDKQLWSPLLAALLFAVHPIDSESVTWIAGRTDPMAALFLLAALYCLLECLVRDRLVPLWPALLLFLLGVLSKEIALGFLPVAMLLVSCWPGSPQVRKRLLRILAGVAAACASLLLCFAVFGRSFSFAALLCGNSAGWPQARIVLTALGFYLKKLVLPLPLNFAIDQVSPLYLLPGLAFLLLLPLPLFSRKWRLPGLLAVLVGVLLLPALLVAVKPVAWTPFAERYLYLPCAFFCLGLGAWGALRLERMGTPRWLVPAGLALALVGAVCTVQRNLVWRDNLSLFRDAVEKSPGFGGVHRELGVALLQEGRLEEARAQFETAQLLNQRPSIRSLILTDLMSVCLRQGNPGSARDHFYRSFPDKQQADPASLGLLNKALEEIAARNADSAVKRGIYRDMIANYELCYSKTNDPFYLYQSAQLAYRSGDAERALANMGQVVRQAPREAPYASAAAVWLRKLKAGLR